MSVVSSGIHHVTAIASAPQVNLDFYIGVVGLRLVKRTVNFDDAGTYHFYYGDAEGRPGSILTFFPWPGAHPGRAGVGSVTATALAVPPGSIDFWMAWLAHRAHEYLEPIEHFGRRVLPLHGPDGLRLEIVESEQAPGIGACSRSPVEAAHQIRGIDGVTLALRSSEETVRLLIDLFGYQEVGEEGGRLRLQSGTGGVGRLIDIVSGEEAGRSGAGTVHHVAFRVRNVEEQQAMREAALARGLQVTDVKDRQYFQSIYFREPGGVLFEVASDGPGFGIDEDLEELGHRLMLPPWLEPRRVEIQRRLPEVAPPPVL